MKYSTLLFSPLSQFAMVATLLILTSIISRFNAKVILLYGFYYFIAWALFAVISNFLIDNYWTFLWQYSIAFVAGIGLLFLLGYLSERIFGHDGGMGWMGMLAIVNIFIVLSLFTVVANLIRSLFL